MNPARTTAAEIFNWLAGPPYRLELDEISTDRISKERRTWRRRRGSPAGSFFSGGGGYGFRPLGGARRVEMGATASRGFVGAVGG